MQSDEWVPSERTDTLDGSIDQVSIGSGAHLPGACLPQPAFSLVTGEQGPRRMGAPSHSCAYRLACWTRWGGSKG